MITCSPFCSHVSQSERAESGTKSRKFISGLFFATQLVQQRPPWTPGIEFVSHVCSYLPLLGVFTAFLPDLGRRADRAVVPRIAAGSLDPVGIYYEKEVALVKPIIEKKTLQFLREL